MHWKRDGRAGAGGGEICLAVGAEELVHLRMVHVCAKGVHKLAEPRKAFYLATFFITDLGHTDTGVP